MLKACPTGYQTTRQSYWNWKCVLLWEHIHCSTKQTSEEALLGRSPSCDKMGGDPHRNISLAQFWPVGWKWELAREWELGKCCFPDANTAPDLSVLLMWNNVKLVAVQPSRPKRPQHQDQRCTLKDGGWRTDGTLEPELQPQQLPCGAGNYFRVTWWTSLPSHILFCYSTVEHVDCIQFLYDNCCSHVSEHKVLGISLIKISS